MKTITLVQLSVFPLMTAVALVGCGKMSAFKPKNPASGKISFMDKDASLYQSDLDKNLALVNKAQDENSLVSNDKNLVSDDGFNYKALRDAEVANKQLSLPQSIVYAAVDVTDGPVSEAQIKDIKITVLLNNGKTYTFINPRTVGTSGLSVEILPEEAIDGDISVRGRIYADETLGKIEFALIKEATNAHDEGVHLEVAGLVFMKNFLSNTYQLQYADLNDSLVKDTQNGKVISESAKKALGISATAKTESKPESKPADQQPTPQKQATDAPKASDSAKKGDSSSPPPATKTDKTQDDAADPGITLAQ